MKHFGKRMTHPVEDSRQKINKRWDSVVTGRSFSQMYHIQITSKIVFSTLIKMIWGPSNIFVLLLVGKNIIVIHSARLVKVISTPKNNALFISKSE